MNRKRLIVLLQLLATVLVFASLLRWIEPHALWVNLQRAPWWSLPAGLVSMTGTLAIAAIRWNALLIAYGADERPPVTRLFQLHVIGMLYNMLPGSIGGDVLRGIVTRSAFGVGNATAGLVIVLVERIVGLCGLILLAGSMLLIRPIMGIQVAWALALGGLVASAAAITGIALSRHLARFLPEKLSAIVRTMPIITKPAWLVLAVVLSVVSQAAVGVTAHAFVVGMDARVSLLDSFTLAPMAFAAAYFPLTIGGAGTRDAAMVGLYATVGVASSDALAASVQILFAYLVYALIGGVVSFVSNVGRELAEAVRNTPKNTENR